MGNGNDAKGMGKQDLGNGNGAEGMGNRDMGNGNDVKDMGNRNDAKDSPCYLPNVAGTKRYPHPLIGPTTVFGRCVYMAGSPTAIGSLSH